MQCKLELYQYNDHYFTMSCFPFGRQTAQKIRNSDYQKHPRSVQVADMRNGKLNLRIEELQKILCPEAVADRKIAVIVCVGTKRRGKSFLMSQFVHELDDDVKKDQQIFECSAKEDACTKGIWAWSKPIVSTKYCTDKPTAILLLDTQGTGDPADTFHDIITMLAFCALTCSVLIYNVGGGITKQNLDELATCASIANNVRNMSHGGKLFQDLVVLVRDFEFKPNEYGFKRGRSYLQKTIGNVSSTCAEANKLSSTINNAFSKVECCVLPHPGRNIESSCGKLTGLDDEFIKQMKTFLTVTLSHLPLVGASSQKQGITCKEWVTTSIDFAHALNQKSPELQVRSIWQSQTAQVNRLCSAIAQKEYKKLASAKLIKSSEKLAAKDLQEFHDVWMAKSVALFDSELKQKSCQIDDQVKSQLITALHEQKGEIELWNEKNDSWLTYAKQHPFKFAAFVIAATAGVAASGPAAWAAAPAVVAVIKANPVIAAAIVNIGKEIVTKAVPAIAKLR